MIPVVQLDPASLTVWFDSELIANMPGDVPVAEAVMHSLRGDVDGLHELVDGPKLDASRVRAIHLASAVWHEQRHFLDLLLTNHGAFRVRQFLSAYGNLAALLFHAHQQGGTIWCPLSVYDDPLEREVLGIEGDAPELREIARDFGVRTEMVLEDRQRIDLPYGTIEVGGEAQFEALAWICQHVAVRRQFGMDAERLVQSDLGETQRGNLLYSWAISLVEDFGLGATEGVHEGVRIVDVSLLLPLLYGSLASRRWGQEQTATETGASGFPAARLSGLLPALRGKGRSVAGDTTTGWRLVNEAAADLFGRSVHDEIRIDLEHEQHFVETMLASGALEAAKDVIADYHRLRRRLVESLEQDAVQFLDPFTYADTFIRTVRPLPVFARPGGVLGQPPLDLERVIAYDDVDSDGPKSEWWWAAVPRDWPWDDPDLVVLSKRNSWLTTIDTLAPTVKLLFHGHRHRLMLGPELIAAEQRLRADGQDVKIHGAFQFPNDLEDGAFFFDLAGVEEATCDICHASITRESAQALSPWAFRREPQATLAIQLFGGGEEGWLRFIRDWSIWLVCSACRDAVERGEGFDHIAQAAPTHL